MAEVNQWR